MIINNSLQVTQTQVNPFHKLDSKVKELTDNQKKVILAAIDALSFLALIFFSSTAVGTIAVAVCLITTGILICTSEFVGLFGDLFIIAADLFISISAKNRTSFSIRCLSSNSSKKHVVRTTNPSLGQDHRHRVGKR